MLRHLLSFERRLLLRNGVFWIVMLVFALLGFGAMASDEISFGGGVGNIMRNAPAVTINLLAVFSVMSVLLATIFVAGIALRDFEQRTAELFLPRRCASATTCWAASAAASWRAWRSCSPPRSACGWAA